MNDLAVAAMIRVEDEHPWYKVRLSFIVELLKGYDPAKTSIMDFGCGAGGALNQCKELGFQMILGVDTSDLCIDATRKRGIPVKKIDYVVPDFASNSFDLIFVLDVLEHLANDLDYLKALADFLSEDGRILVTVPAHTFLWSYHDEVNFHFRRYSKKQLMALVNKAGLEIETLRYWNSLLLPYLYFIRKIKKKHTNKPESEYELPPKLLIKPLYSLLKYESKSKMLSKFPGVSLVAVLRKNSKATTVQ
jgi:SAM-dependent methyltransferase